MQGFNVDEADVTRAIVTEYLEELKQLAEVDVIIVGSGPAGTVAAKRLAEQDVDVLMVERNIKPGGGMLLGGMLMNKMTIEEPALRILEEVGVKSLKKYKDNLYTANAYEVSTKLLASAFDAGAKLLNGVQVEDVIFRDDGIRGCVLNWHAISEMPWWVTCVDPLAFKSEVVIDATGHAAEVAKLCADKIGGFEVRQLEGAMWVEKAEIATIEGTREIHPGLIVTGMAVNGVSCAPRMGPIFGAMFLSGEKAANIALQKLGRKPLEYETFEKVQE